MPNPNVGLFAAPALAAMSDTFNYWSGDESNVLGDDGMVCGVGGAKIILCDCAVGQTPHLPVSVGVCTSQQTFSWGCKFSGAATSNRAFYCVARDVVDGLLDVCNICTCRGAGSTDGWQSLGSNRVSRDNYEEWSETTWGLRCTVTASTEYGCAAGYYQSGGSGASMTCSRCPALGGVYGTNSVGSTSITSCAIPANTSMTETAGTSVFTSSCSYSN